MTHQTQTVEFPGWLEMVLAHMRVECPHEYETLHQIMDEHPFEVGQELPETTMHYVLGLVTGQVISYLVQCRTKKVKPVREYLRPGYYDARS